SSAVSASFRNSMMSASPCTGPLRSRRRSGCWDGLPVQVPAEQFDDHLDAAATPSAGAATGGDLVDSSRTARDQLADPAIVHDLAVADDHQALPDPGTTTSTGTCRRA